MACIYKFGEFDITEFFDPENPETGEFFLGYRDCSDPAEGVECDNLFIYPKPHLNDAWEKDYILMNAYITKDVKDNLVKMKSNLEIGKDSEKELNFSTQAYYLIEHLLLFKQELTKKPLPTIDEYLVLFDKYKLLCIDKHFRLFFARPKYVKDMMKIMKIAEILHLTDVVYQYSGNPEADPVYYLASL